MKFLSVLLFLFLLASCGGNKTSEIKDMDHDTSKIIVEDMNQEIDDIEDEFYEDMDALENQAAEDLEAIEDEAFLDDFIEDIDDTIIEDEAIVDEFYEEPINDSADEITADEPDTTLEEELTEVTEEIETETGNEIKTIETTYTNPNGEVNMTINFQLDSEGNIGDISVVADNYDLSEFNDYTQSLIGGTLEEATEAYLSGSSLATAAFQNAMKAELK